MSGSAISCAASRSRASKRAFFEFTSEGCSLGVVGALVLLAFAVPAFDEINKDWRNAGGFRRHLPRPLRQPDRQARHPAGRHGRARGPSRPPRQGGARHRGPPLLRAFRHRRVRHLPRHPGERARRRRGAGRLLDHPAARQEPVPVERAHAAAQDQGGLSRAVAGGQPLQARDPEALSSTAPIWAAARSAWVRPSEFYFGKKVQDLDLAESRDARRPVQGADQLRAAHQPAGRARPRQRGAHQHGAGRLHDRRARWSARAAHPAVAGRALASRLRRLLPRLGLRAGEEPRRRTRQGADRAHHPRHAAAEGGRSRRSNRRCGNRAKQYNVSQGALVSMEPDGACAPWSAGATTAPSTFNRAVNALRQPGSSFKPYVYADGAGDREIRCPTPSSSMRRSRSATGRRRTMAAPSRGGCRSAARSRQSLNTVAVRLSIATGRQPIADLAARMGVSTPLTVTRSLPLGTSELTVLDQATGYAAFANGGYRAVPARPSSTCAPRSGKLVYDAAADPPPRQRVLTEKTVLGMIDMLHDVVEHGTGRRAQLPGHQRRRQDGHDQRLPRCLVRRLHRQLHHRRVARQRQLRVDQPADRRHPAGRDLAEIHARRHGLRGAEAPARPAAAGAAPTSSSMADTGGWRSRAFDPGASGRLAPETADALGRLEERFRKAPAARRQCGRPRLVRRPPSDSRP